MKYFWQYSEFPNFHFNIGEHISQIHGFDDQLGKVNGLFVNVSETNKKEIFSPL